MYIQLCISKSGDWYSKTVVLKYTEKNYKNAEIMKISTDCSFKKKAKWTPPLYRYREKIDSCQRSG